MDCDLPTLQLDCLALSFYFQDRYRKGFWWLPNLTIPSYFCFFSWDKNQMCDKVYTIKSGLSHLLWKIYKLTQKYNFLYFLAKVYTQIILFKQTLQARFVCLSTLLTTCPSTKQRTTEDIASFRGGFWGSVQDQLSNLSRDMFGSFLWKLNEFFSLSHGSMSESSDGNKMDYYVLTTFQTKCSTFYMLSHVILTKPLWTK